MMKPLRGLVVAPDEVVEANDNLVDNPSQEARSVFRIACTSFASGSQCSIVNALDGNQTQGAHGRWGYHR